MAPIRTDCQPAPDFEQSLGRCRANADHCSIFLDEILNFGLHPEVKRRISLGVLGDEVEKIPLRHERDELTASRQVGEVGDRNLHSPDHARQVLGFLVRSLQEVIQ